MFERFDRFDSFFEPQLKQTTLGHWAYIATLSYAALSLLLFQVAFLSASWAIPASIMLGASFVFVINNEWKKLRAAGVNRVDKAWLVLIALFIVAVVISAFFGAGFFGSSTDDQLKNQELIAELVRHDWPVQFPDALPDFRFLSYPLGYYLVPALGFKVLGWNIAGSIIYLLWSSFGLFLFLAWVYYFFGKAVFPFIPIFFLFGGWDFIGYTLVNGHLPTLDTAYLDYWAKVVQFSSFTTELAWPMQHTFVSWVVPLALLYKITSSKDAVGVLLLLVLSTFWSHVTVLGLIVLLPFFVTKEKLRSMLSWELAGVLPLLGILAYYLSKGSGAIPAGPITERLAFPTLLPYLLVFWFLELLLPLAFVLLSFKFRSGKEKYLIVIIVSFLFLVTLFYVGIANDLTMRASQPALLLLFFFFYSGMCNAVRNKQIGILVLGGLYLYVGAYASLLEIVRAFQVIWPLSSGVFNLPPLSSLDPLLNRYPAQYAGKESSIFYQYLLNK